MVWEARVVFRLLPGDRHWQCYFYPFNIEVLLQLILVHRPTIVRVAFLHRNGH